MIIGSDKVVLRVCISSFGACRMLFDVSCIHFPETVLCQLKHLLGLANRRAHVAMLNLEFLPLLSGLVIAALRVFFVDA